MHNVRKDKTEYIKKRGKMKAQERESTKRRERKKNFEAY
jgi:hypothetical protein